jgi:hypothetical protein
MHSRPQTHTRDPKPCSTERVEVPTYPKVRVSPAKRICVNLRNLGRSPSAQMATEGDGFGETALPVTLKVSPMALRNNRRSLVV